MVSNEKRREVVEGISSDNVFGVELPKDANGKVIPLDTEVLYDKYENVFHVVDFRYSPKEREWLASGGFTGPKDSWRLDTNRLLLAPTDSWERLEEDAKKNPCRYFGMSEDQNASCKTCPHGPWATDRICGENMRLDLIERAKKLAGIEEEQR